MLAQEARREAARPAKEAQMAKRAAEERKSAEAAGYKTKVDREGAAAGDVEAPAPLPLDTCVYCTPRV